jgi:hypothetical protein
MFCKYIVNKSNTFAWVTNGTVTMGVTTFKCKHNHGDNWMDHVLACKESYNTRVLVQGNSWCYRWSRLDNDLNGQRKWYSKHALLECCDQRNF